MSRRTPSPDPAFDLAGDADVGWNDREECAENTVRPHARNRVRHVETHRRKAKKFGLQKYLKLSHRLKPSHP